MVAAVSAGKSSSVISVHFALQATPTINQGLPIDIAIVPHEKFGAVRAHFDGQEDLPVTSGEEFGPAREPAKDKALVHQLVLLPRREGVFVITMSVDSEDTHGSTTRIYSIPVIVAAAAAPPIPAESPAPAPAPAATG
jgi:hypothetical protein